MRIVCLLYEDFLLLDAAGALGAFELAGRSGCEGYSIEMIAATTGPVRSSGGIQLLARDWRECGEFDTLLIRVAMAPRTVGNIAISSPSSSGPLARGAA